MGLRKSEIDIKDIKHLVAVAKQVRFELDMGEGDPRAAAKILCKELKWLAGRAEFWRSLEVGSKALDDYKKQHPEYDWTDDIRPLIDLESETFSRIGIPSEQSDPVLTLVYGAVDLAGERPRPSPQALNNLRNRLGLASDLVCKASEGVLSKIFHAVVSVKGLRIVAGASVAGANVAVAHFDFGVVSWKSLSVGYAVMTADVEALMKLLGKKEP